MDTRQHLSRRIKAYAHELGFDLCRITPVATAPNADFFQTWLELGRAGEMAYLARHTHKRRRPAALAEAGPPLRSMLVLAVDYHQFHLPAALRDDPARGIIASYAWGDDYHEIIRPLLYELDAFVARQSGRTTHGKCLVDTGPVLERDWAQQAGLGFTGKNCCTITPGMGSKLFLAVVLVPESLAYDAPAQPLDDAARRPPSPGAVAAGLPAGEQYGRWMLEIERHEFTDDETISRQTSPREGTCGACTRCLTDCPTDAFVGPFHLDPQRCISYWTIEARSPIPRELRPHFTNRIFGCDICQEVCPWNRRLPRRIPRLWGLEAYADRVAIPLLEGFAHDTPYWLSDAAFAQRFRRSPIRRAKRAGMLRNVCVALGNWAAPETVPALMAALQDSTPLGRGHGAWALGRVLRRHGSDQARAALAAAQASETEPWVREEISTAMSTM